MENFEDHSAPPSPDEKDSGFFMLRKDSERRATLHHILTEDRETVVGNIMEALHQVHTHARTHAHTHTHTLWWGTQQEIRSHLVLIPPKGHLVFRGQIISI